jgi:hypothetical protein
MEKRRRSPARVELLEKIADLAAHSAEFSRAGFSPNASPLKPSSEDYRIKMRTLLQALEIFDAC